MQSADILLHKLQLILHSKPLNIRAICEIGHTLGQLGRTHESRKCYGIAVEALHTAAKAGDVERALGFEYLIYAAFVKTVEDEQHYYRCFADWKNELAGMGRRLRDPAPLSVDDAEGVGFVLQTGALLGHTEVLLRLLEARPRQEGHGHDPRVYVLGDLESQFVGRCRGMGIEVVPVAREMSRGMGPGTTLPWKDRFLWLRKRFREDSIRTSVWVSAPTMVAFAYAMRIAPVQIFWALRFHPIAAPYIDGYITYGGRHERERVFGKQVWQVCPMPLAIDATLPDPRAVAELREQLPKGFLMGTLARPEKIDSKPFLNSVVGILKANPQARYLWTGRQEHAGIAGLFRSEGVGDRCHFVGWVDTRLYAAALDLFLESFPFGTGIVPYQALAAGVPLLSYFSEMTIFGVNFSREYPDGNPENLDRHPILCARTPEEYVQLANRLIADADFRSNVASRGQQFFREELDNLPYYSKRFFETIEAVATNASRSRQAMTAQQ